MGGHVAVTCRITLNHPSTRRGTLWQITLTTCYLWTPHLHSRTDSEALRAEYCIVGIPHNAVSATVSELLHLEKFQRVVATVKVTEGH